MIDKEKQLKLLSTAITQCSKCILSSTRNNIVFGSGNISSRLFFIGEAPGAQEDKQGTPFVGRAGKLFDSLLSSINLNRNDVYVANILKCRPPKNRNPKRNEIQQCTPYLKQQLHIIQPDIISSMGNFATKYCCNQFDIPFHNISTLHGQIFPITCNAKPSLLIPLYHPAAAVYNPNLLESMKKDFYQIKNQLIILK
jgi:DNA polymerase